MKSINGILHFLKPKEMKFLKLTSFLLLCLVQYSAHAQGMDKYYEFTKTADSLVKVNEFYQSEVLYIKAFKIFKQDPVLQRKIASVYLRLHKTDDADRFIKLAINNGADMEILLADTNIVNYLKVHPKEVAVYSSLSKQHKLLSQIKNKNRWIDDYREEF
jgi:hypothetical protein